MNEASDINVLTLVKGDERYVFMFDDESRAECLRQFGRWASHPDLKFTWYDAAVLSQKVRGQPGTSTDQQPRHYTVTQTKKPKYTLTPRW